MIVSSDQAPELLQEYLRRDAHAINQYKPTEFDEHNQLSFHSSPAHYRLLFGGNQSGKSHAAAYEIACWATGDHPHRKVNEPPNEIWVISAEYSTLKTGIFRHLDNMLPDWKVKRYGPNVPNNNLPSFIEMKNGSTITFMSAKGDAREKFQAAAVDLISIDEEITETIWEELEARTLATGGNFIISATLVESYEWILLLERAAERGDPNVFLTRLNTELNPYLDKERVDFLKKKWSKETLEYRFYGKSRRTTGLVYNTWKDKEHVIDSFPIPNDWPRWCALDPGIRTFAVLWIAVDPDNHAYAYRELYAHSEPLHQIAAAIRTAEGWKLNKELSFRYNHYVWEEREKSEHMIIRLIDDKRSSRLITGDPGVLTQLYERYGLASTPAEKELRPGIEEVRLWLEPMKDGKPGFRVLRHLEEFQDERRQYRIRPRQRKKYQNEAIDEPVRKRNHLMDTWRYIARENPKWSDRFRSASFVDAKEVLSPADRIQQSLQKASTNEWLGSEW